jgi:deoxyadenosine/deoxycytidine kinase
MVFAKMLYDSKKIEHVNYLIYLNWFDTFSEEFPVHKVIYVKTSPEKCFERIVKRSRTGEENIPIEYLEGCSNYHDNMLNKESIDCVCNDQLVLDGNVDIYENKEQVKEWISQIDNFISNMLIFIKHFIKFLGTETAINFPHFVTFILFPL